MTIFLKAPEPPPGGPDGKGWNRLSLAAHYGRPADQCALKPRTYAAYIESLDTHRAAWGPFGPCHRPRRPHGCNGCPVLELDSRLPIQLPASVRRLCVRVDGDNRPHIMLDRERGWNAPGNADQLGAAVPHERLESRPSTAR